MSRWLETRCGYCRTPIYYLPEWTYIPEYCKDCNEWQEKSCANPHCGGTIRYKIYWSNIHDYCADCKGWYEVRCSNNRCFQKFTVHCDWDNPPEYCPECRQWQEKPCENPECNGIVRYKAYWDNIPDYCNCKGWYEKKCECDGCNERIRIHASWSNPTRFCKRQHYVDCQNPHCDGKVAVNLYDPSRTHKYCSCNGLYTIKCECGADIEIFCEWNNPPTACKICKTSRLSRARYEEKSRPDGTGHRTWYDPETNSRMSWDVDENNNYVPGTGHDIPDQSRTHNNQWDKRR